MTAQPSPAPSPVAAPAAMLAEELLDETKALTDALVDAIWASDPAYVAGTVDVDEVWRSCHANISRVIQALAGVVPRSVDPYDAPRETGARRAEEDVPLESVLHSYRVGGRLIWQAMVARSRESHSAPDDLLDAATSVWEVVDSFSSQVALAYRATEAERARRDAQQAQSLVAALFDGRVVEVADAVTSALGLDADEEYAVVATPHGAEGPARAALAAHRLPALWTAQGGFEAAVVSLGGRGLAAARQALESLAETAAGVAPAHGLTGLRGAWQEATLALSTLPRDAHGPVTLEDRLPEALLMNAPALAERLVRCTLGPLLDLGAPEAQVLVGTLETWLGCERSPTRTAQALYCHRNTVLNRLHRVGSLTDLRFDDEGHALRLSLALRALALRAEEAGARERASL